MEVSQAIKERCCTRKFSDKKPTKEQLTAILEAARLAPSWVNVQPWHFIVVQDPETIKLLGELSYNQPHVKGANTIIVCCGTLDSWNKDKFKEIIVKRPNITEEQINFILNEPSLSPVLLGNETVMIRTVEEITYAIAYMTLEIENQGLAACIIGRMGGPLTKSNLDIYEEAAKKLKLPTDSLIITMLVVGYADEEKPAKKRKAFSDVVSFDNYGNKF